MLLPTVNPVHHAAYGGDRGALALCVAEHGGAAVNAADYTGWTPLHVAVYRGHTDSARWLLGQGARVDAVDQIGQTPLHVAAYRRVHGAAALLLDHGANLDRVDIAGWTPLHGAADFGDREMVTLLADRGAEMTGRARRIGHPFSWRFWGPGSRPPMDRRTSGRLDRNASLGVERIADQGVLCREVRLKEEKCRGGITG